MSKRQKGSESRNKGGGAPAHFEPPDLEALGVTEDEFLEACRWFVEHFAALDGLSPNQVGRLKRRERRRALERLLRKQGAGAGRARG
jgi:hypothetical protein